jgi:uncharacterized protein (TIGR02217 family)
VSNQLFPAKYLPGLAWELDFRPLWSNGTQESTSGREVRTAYWANPRWELDLKFNYLRDNYDPKYINEAGNTELATLVGFFNQMKGGFDSFLVNLTDLTKNDHDSVVTGQPIGTGDGSNKNFQLVRNFGGFLEAIQNPANQVAQVFDAGVEKTQNADYTVANGLVSFVTAPLTGHAITANFTALWRCRFNTSGGTSIRSQGSADPSFNNWMFMIYKCQQISLITVRS